MATEDVTGGAASGAAQGASFGPYGAVIGAGIGAISGFMSGRRRKTAELRERRRQDRIRTLATPQHLNDVIQSLAPMFRQIVASGLGPQFQTAVADSLAKHGLTGTGVGEAFRSSAEAAPAIFTTQMATEEGRSVVGRELAAEGLAGPAPAPSQNPLLDALMGGARGFMAAGGSSALPSRTSGAPVNYGPEGIMTGQAPLPNLTPVTQFPSGYAPSVFRK